MKIMKCLITILILALVLVSGCSVAGTDDKMSVTQPSRKSIQTGEKKTVVTGASQIVITKDGQIVVNGVAK